MHRRLVLSLMAMAALLLGIAVPQVLATPDGPIGMTLDGDEWFCHQAGTLGIIEMMVDPDSRGEPSAERAALAAGELVEAMTSPDGGRLGDIVQVSLSRAPDRDALGWTSFAMVDRGVVVLQVDTVQLLSGGYAAERIVACESDLLGDSVQQAEVQR